MKADRYVVGIPGDYVYGIDRNGLIGWIQSLSLSTARIIARKPWMNTPIIYRLVPVRRVKAQRGKK
jgi:SH3-like domain-containing protein